VTNLTIARTRVCHNCITVVRWLPSGRVVVTYEGVTSADTAESPDRVRHGCVRRAGDPPQHWGEFLAHRFSGVPG